MISTICLQSSTGSYLMERLLHSLSFHTSCETSSPQNDISERDPPPLTVHSGRTIPSATTVNSIDNPNTICPMRKNVPDETFRFIKVMKTKTDEKLRRGRIYCIESIFGGTHMQHRNCGKHPEIRDYGCEPFIFNINHATNRNENFRTTLWTGDHLQLTLMSIPVCGDIGAEMHPDVDQFLRIVSGRAKVYMGSCRNDLQEKACVDGNYAILIPAGTWHNIVNVGNRPLKLYSLYAPSQHPFGTVHRTKEEAEQAGD